MPMPIDKYSLFNLEIAFVMFWETILSISVHLILQNRTVPYINIKNQ